MPMLKWTLFQIKASITPFITIFTKCKYNSCDGSSKEKRITNLVITAVKILTVSRFEKG